MAKTQTLIDRASTPSHSPAARARRIRCVQRLGALHGAEDVQDKVQDEGAEVVAEWPVRGWDEAAINAGVFGIVLPTVRDEALKAAYYTAYERGANAAHRALRAS